MKTVVTTAARGQRTQALIAQIRATLMQDAVRVGARRWLAQLIALMAVTVIGLVFMPAAALRNHVFAPQSARPAFHSLRALFNTWALSDGHYYLHIAAVGYARGDAHIYAGFSPLYPLLIHVLTPLVGGIGHQIFAALLVSGLAALAAYIGLAFYAADVLPQGSSASRRVVAIAAAYPFAFFLFVAYSDALFLALAIWALYLARRQCWWHAAALAFLAGFARLPTAPALMLPLLVLAIRHVRAHNWQRSFLLPPAIAVLGVPLALLSWGTYCAIVFGDPLIMLHVQQQMFGHVLQWPWQTLLISLGQLHAAPLFSFRALRVLVDLVPLLVALGLFPLLVRSAPLDETLYVAVLLLPILISPTIHARFPDAVVSAGRYLLPAFPLALVLARLGARWPALDRALTTVGPMLQAVLFLFAVSGGWLV